MLYMQKIPTICRHFKGSIQPYAVVHFWKSCIPQKGIEGSNPSFSAKNPECHCIQDFY